MSRGRKPNVKAHKRALPAKEAFSLIPKGPWQNGRSSLTLLLVERDANGRRISSVYTCPDVMELNTRYKEGSLTPDEARAELEKVRAKEYARIEAARLEHLHTNNIELVKRYVSTIIDKKVDILTSSRNSQIDAAWAAVRLMKGLDLGKATQNEIQRILNSVESSGAFAKHVQSVRAMLRFMGRHEVAASLKMKRFEDKKPPYLSKEQVYKLVKNIPHETLEKWPLMPELIRIIFNLGLRFSEALAIQKPDVMKKDGVTVVHIHRQYAAKVKGESEDDRLRKTKNRRARYVVPLNTQECLTDMAKWITTYPEIKDREQYRGVASKLVHQLAKKLFGVDSMEAVDESENFFFDESSLPDVQEVRDYKGIHMLRASHAVLLMEEFGNENIAANQLGDTPEVIRKHYSGRFNTDKTLKFMAETLSKKPVKK